MSRDDSYDPDATVIRPTPGVRRAAEPARPPGRPAFQPAPPPPSAPPLPAADPAPFVAAPLPPHPPHAAGPAQAAATILMQLSRLRGMARAPDVEALHAAMVEEVKRCKAALLALGLAEETLLQAQYAVCATIDDVVLNTPWGRSTAWARRGMVSIFHGETISGERFFDILNRLKSDPGRNAGLLELMYHCLSLGFQGHMRLEPRGAAHIERLREDLHRLLRRDEDVNELSPRWRGVREPPRRLGAVVPAWVAASVAGLVLLVAYAGFTAMLAAESDPLAGRLSALPGQAAPPMARPRPPAPPPPVPETARIAPRVSKFLQREIDEGLVSVTETMDSLLVRIRNRGLFASASARVEPGFVPIIQRIAQALEAEAGQITVTGHTDSQPISIRFPSNWHLSVARADAVAAIIAKSLSDRGRLKTVGMGDTDPVAGNDTAEGREANRRIDVRLGKSGP